MKTFREYCEERLRLQREMMQAADGSTMTFDPSDMDLFNRAKMDIAKQAGIDMSKPVDVQLQKKAVADNVLKAAQKNPNFKKIKNPALNSVAGLQKAFAASSDQNKGVAA
jgi:hypothetical protein